MRQDEMGSSSCQRVGAGVAIGLALLYLGLLAFILILRPAVSPRACVAITYAGLLVPLIATGGLLVMEQRGGRD